MSPELEILLWRRGLAFDRTVGACKPVDGLTPASVQRIRPGCRHFTSEALRQRAQATPTRWQRVKAWFRSVFA